jgi:hypothetical protein
MSKIKEGFPQIRFKTAILPQETKNLPPFCREGIKNNIITPLQEMLEKDLLCKIRTPQELNQILPQAQNTAQGIFDSLRRFNPEPKSFWSPDSWRKALLVAQRTVELTTQKLDRKEAQKYCRGQAEKLAAIVIHEAAQEITPKITTKQDRNVEFQTVYHMIWDVQWAASLGAAWEVVKDQPDFKQNPFLFYLELHKLGAASIKFGQGKERGKLRVDFPLKLKALNVLACLYFNDGGPYPQQVSWIHNWDQECSKRYPLKGKKNLS